MLLRRWITIAACIVGFSLVVFTPLSDTSAGSPPQVVEGTVGTIWCPCGPNCPQPPSLTTLSTEPLPVAPLAGRGICIGGCLEIYGEASHTFDVPPNSPYSVVGETNSLCWGMSFRITPGESCTLVPSYSSKAYFLSWGWDCMAPESGQVIVTAHGLGGYRITVAEIDLLEPSPVEVERSAGLQRINQWSAIPYVVYVPTAARAAAEDTQFIDVWHLDAYGVGQPLLYVSKEQLLALPATPAENLLIATSPDGVVNVYKLTTGEYQVNIGPLADGKVYTTIFDAIPPTTITHSAWVMSPQ